MIEKKIKGLMDLNGAYVTEKGMVIIKAEDNSSMEIVNMGSWFSCKSTVVTLNLGKPAITSLLRELGIVVIFDGEEETNVSSVQSGIVKEKDLQSRALNRLYSELDYCKTSYEYEKVLSLIERTKRL